MELQRKALKRKRDSDSNDNSYLEETADTDISKDTSDAPPRAKYSVSNNRDSPPSPSWLQTSSKQIESSSSQNHYQPNSRPTVPPPPPSRIQVVTQNSPPKVTPKPRYDNSVVRAKSALGNGPRKALVSNTEALYHSIVKIRDGIADGSLVAQFEKLKRGTGASMNDAKAKENVFKNRYRDISPYDHSRVRIQGCDGDYINASFIELNIPKSNVQKHYIASQGPLRETCADFWQMCWEKECELIVMLTALREQGRVKCHKYYPDVDHTFEFTWTYTRPGKLSSSSVKCIQLRISNIKEEEDAGIICREIQLQRLVTTAKDMLNSTGGFKFREMKFPREKGPGIVAGADVRRITQLQYGSWPDHGVPSTCSDLISFVERMRAIRESGKSSCAIVHCSAGIGRTGVVILLDTAMDMIHANSPIQPIEIVRQMREYREMLIQTPAQFRFVCEAIVDYYDGLLKSQKPKKS